MNVESNVEFNGGMRRRNFGRSLVWINIFVNTFSSFGWATMVVRHPKHQTCVESLIYLDF